MMQQEFDWLTKLEREVDKHWDDLTKWEKTFTENLLERFRRYGIKTMISKREWEVITEISDKAIM
jgi:hypothetical protein